MRKHFVRYSVPLGVAIGIGLACTSAIGGQRNACQVLPASQAGRIFGSPVTTSLTSQKQGGNSSTICGYSSTTSGAEHSSQLQVVYAKSVDVAIALEKQIRALQGASPAVNIGRKGNVVVKFEADIPPDRSRVHALFQAAMKHL